ncbi:hypothetical protein DL93DRAFT_1599360, partial [Clavulina sp. PMI_390]
GYVNRSVLGHDQVFLTSGRPGCAVPRAQPEAIETPLPHLPCLISLTIDWSKNLNPIGVVSSLAPTIQRLELLGYNRFDEILQNLVEADPCPKVEYISLRPTPFSNSPPMSGHDAMFQWYVGQHTTQGVVGHCLYQLMEKKPLLRLNVRVGGTGWQATEFRLLKSTFQDRFEVRDISKDGRSMG